ncbi:MAG: hypothetical protein HY791_09260 [Deltaproteobacteria bacterium]|nr:hypothetical protein [Deltaproteobacteria bacterium]
MGNERGSRKIPVTERQFLWVQDDDKGEVILHVGPTMVSPTAADRVVIDDGQGGFVEDPSGQPQRMVELADSQYAVLFNPLAENDGGPNGKFRSGRNEQKVLKNGTRHMIPGPCSFFLRPGQRVEVRDAHELASNQYLVVKVYGEVDRAAPYYEITARSAAITAATAEDVGDTPQTGISTVAPVELKRGQLVVIRGLDTQFYVPPTGVDVVPDLAVDAYGTQVTAAMARKILASAPMPGTAAAGAVAAAPPPAPARAYDELAAESQMAELEAKPALRRKEKDAKVAIDQSARFRQQAARPAPPAPEEKREEPVGADLVQVLSSDIHRQALEREMRKARLVRQAVVLGEKEFCVILDADGKRQIKVGPARVFPGPYDSFMTKGSNNRIYYAFELLPQRALWVRFIAPIPKEKLTHKLPRGIDLTEATYHPGDELILTGVNCFFFPFNEIEVLHPATGQPHVGNDHSDVFIEAIGIDQKSGIYVRDLSTGEARLVRGKQSYLVDPRKEVHITRTVPTDEWNLWVGAQEPHKMTREPTTTPWAVSITVAHNTAALASSAAGQRVIEGPCVALLEYDERLVPMTLSTGTPKSDAKMLRTCFLRTAGNRVSDVITLETADFVRINVTVSYEVVFESALKDRWFNHENYVGVLTDHLRSLVRSRCRQMRLIDLWPNVPSLLRDIILGERTDAGRKGRSFPENGMKVTEVEVLQSVILDEEIATLLDRVQRESVALVIGDRQVTEQLRSDKLRQDVDRERTELQRESEERRAALEDLLLRLRQAQKLAVLKGDEEGKRAAAELEAWRELTVLDARIDREKRASDALVTRRIAESEAEARANRLLHEEETAFKRALADTQIALRDAEAKATVDERKAVQPALVEALQAVGDKVLLGEVAQNMNLVSLFKGQDVASIFRDVVGGTKLGRTIQTLLPEEPANGTQKP